MFLSAGFGLIKVILINWYFGCKDYNSMNEKCHGKKSEDWLFNVYLFSEICEALSQMFYFHGHFIFAYRYLESAEMLGRKD
jgi:hypothetical protein